MSGVKWYQFMYHKSVCRFEIEHCIFNATYLLNWNTSLCVINLYDMFTFSSIRERHHNHTDHLTCLEINWIHMSAGPTQLCKLGCEMRPMRSQLFTRTTPLGFILEQPQNGHSTAIVKSMVKIYYLLHGYCVHKYSTYLFELPIKYL